MLGHVLKDFAASDALWLQPLLERIGDHVALLLAGDAQAFMSKVAPPPPPRKKPPRADADGGTDGAGDDAG